MKLAAAVVFTVLYSARAFAVCANWSTTSPRPLTVPGNRGGITADFDGDGNLDVLTYDVGLRIAFGDGTGGFTRSILLLDQSLIGAAAVADLTGDGRPDIVIPLASDGSGPGLLENRGDGMFSEPRPLAGFGSVFRFVVGDFNGDGRPDLFVHGGFGGGRQMSKLIGDGHGNFTAAAAGIEGQPSALIAADFNGDGKDDIAFVEGTSVHVAASDGSGRFEQIAELPVAATSIAAADLNRDGRADLAIAGSGGVTIALSTGTGFTINPVAGAGNARAIAIGDFDRDGPPDLAVVTTDPPGISSLLNNGNGSFRLADAYALPAAPQWIAVADLDHDGVDDVVGSGIFTILGSGRGTFLRDERIATAAEPSQVIAADFDGDGNVDLAVRGSAPGVTIHWNSGQGFTAESPAALGTIVSELAIADLDGDGRPELLQNLGNGFAAYRSVNRAFALAGAYTSNGQQATTVGGDFDGDGRQDVAVTAAGGIDIVSFAGGSPQRLVHLDLGSEKLQPVAVGDFDRDGHLDLVIMRPGTAPSFIGPNPAHDGFVDLLLNHGDLTFERRRILDFVAPFRVLRGDFDGDGRPDLAVALYEETQIKGLIAFSSPNARDYIIQRLDPTLRGSWPLAAADLDRDGRDDLLAITEDYVAAYLFRTPALGARVVGLRPLNAAPWAVTAADIHHSGGLDVITANRFLSNDLSIIGSRCVAVHRRTVRR